MKKLYLVGCEESQSLTIALRKFGIEAYSCDTLDCSGGHAEWHIKDDVEYILKQAQWHTFIGFPPCTFLCNAQAHLCVSDIERREKQELAFQFFLRLMNAPVNRIALENPAGYINTAFRHPDQIISPNEFGDLYYKDICLWLKNMPLIKPSRIVKAEKKLDNHVNGRMTNEERSRIKSTWKYFPNMCTAIAQQWSKEYVNISALMSPDLSPVP